MPLIKRYVWLSYKDEGYEYWVVADSDKAALVEAIRRLERDLGKMNGSLRKEFKADGSNWEVKIC